MIIYSDVHLKDKSLGGKTARLHYLHKLRKRYLDIIDHVNQTKKLKV